MIRIQFMMIKNTLLLKDKIKNWLSERGKIV